MKYSINNNQELVGRSLHVAGFLVIALVLALFYKLGYTELANQRDVHVQRAEQLDKLLATSDGVHKRHQALRQELDQLELAITKMHSRLPNKLRKQPFEDSVRYAATKAGFKFEQATWDASSSTPSHSHARVTVNGIGSFASICRFLDEINQLARITKISQLKLKTDSEPTGYPLQVTFVLVYGIGSNDVVDTVDTDRKEGVL